MKVLILLIAIVSVYSFSSCKPHTNEIITDETFLARKDSLKELIKVAYDSVKKFRDYNPVKYDMIVAKLKTEIISSEELCANIQAMLKAKKIYKNDIKIINLDIRSLAHCYEHDKYYIDTILNFQIPDTNRLTPYKLFLSNESEIRNNLRLIGLDFFKSTLQFTKQYQKRIYRQFFINDTIFKEQCRKGLINL